MPNSGRKVIKRDHGQSGVTRDVPRNMPLVRSEVSVFFLEGGPVLVSFCVSLSLTLPSHSRQSTPVLPPAEFGTFRLVISFPRTLGSGPFFSGVVHFSALFVSCAHSNQTPHCSRRQEMRPDGLVWHCRTVEPANGPILTSG